jgi:hypothetical protein
VGVSKRILMEQQERDFFEDVVCGRLEDVTFESEFGTWTRPLYLRYLQTDWWRQLRARALELAGNLCQMPGCRSAKRLEVHHRHYETIGREDPAADLIVLCHRHHRAEHAA